MRGKRKVLIVWSRHTTEKFIKLLRTERCLWDAGIPEYSIREKRVNSLNSMWMELLADIPTLSKDDVRSKIFSLRSQYRKQMRQLIASRSKDSSCTLTPTLWCFDLLSFLEPVLRLKKNLPIKEKSSLKDEFKEEESNDFVAIPHVDMGLSAEESEPSDYKMSQSTEAESMRSSTSERPLSALRPERVKIDRHDTFGKNVSMKLRYLTNNTQRILAEKLINEALFLAEMEQLTQSHTIYLTSYNNY